MFFLFLPRILLSLDCTRRFDLKRFWRPLPRQVAEESGAYVLEDGQKVWNKRRETNPENIPMTMEDWWCRSYLNNEKYLKLFRVSTFSGMNLLPSYVGISLHKPWNKDPVLKQPVYMERIRVCFFKFVIHLMPADMTRIWMAPRSNPIHGQIWR